MLQTMLNVKVELAGKLVRVMPAPCKLAIVTFPAAGQTAAPVTPVQVIDVQFMPATMGSVSTAPEASAGPMFATVTV